MSIVFVYRSSACDAQQQQPRAANRKGFPVADRRASPVATARHWPVTSGHQANDIWPVTVWSSSYGQGSMATSVQYHAPWEKEPQKISRGRSPAKSTGHIGRHRLGTSGH
ncbi:unnamed protein product [Sphagnum balticum]